MKSSDIGGSPVAWDGFGSDTREALKGASAESRKSFHRASSQRKRFGVVMIALSSALILVGFAIEKPIGYAFVLGGVLCAEIAAVSLSYGS